MSKQKDVNIHVNHAEKGNVDIFRPIEITEPRSATINFKSDTLPILSTVKVKLTYLVCLTQNIRLITEN